MAKLSAREKWAKETGRPKEEYNSSSSSDYSKNEKKVIEMMKDAGVYDSYKKLSDDQKELTLYNYTINAADSKDKIKKLGEALDEATKQADPYWSSFLTVAKDEVVRAYDDTKQSHDYQKTDLETKISQIGEDLAKNKDFYTLEQQSDLAKLKQSYEQQRDTVIEDAASKGLTFSTNREKPLQQLETYNQNVVESTNRQYEKKLGDITTEAGKGTLDATTKIEQLDKELGSKLTDIGRSAEQKLGSENLPTLEGYDALGDISGDLYENKVKDIEARKEAIFDEKIQTSLNF